MEKILKFSSPKPASFKRPPKLNTQEYYSEHEEDHNFYFDHSNHGHFIKIYTKKEPTHLPESLKPIYETDQEPKVSSFKGFSFDFVLLLNKMKSQSFRTSSLHTSSSSLSKVLFITFQEKQPSEEKEPKT